MFDPPIPSSSPGSRPGTDRPRAARLHVRQDARATWELSGAFRALFAACSTQQLASGDVAVTPHGDARIGYVTSGHLALLHRNGRLLSILRPGAFFNEGAVFDGGEASRDLVWKARTESLVLRLEATHFRDLARHRPELWVELGRQLSARVEENWERHTEMVTQPFQVRIERTLRRYLSADDRPDADGCIPLPFRRDELGDLAGCGRKQAGMALRELELAGRVVCRGHRVLVPGHVVAEARRDQARAAATTDTTSAN